MYACFSSLNSNYAENSMQLFRKIYIKFDKLDPIIDLKNRFYFNLHLHQHKPHCYFHHQ